MSADPRGVLRGQCTVCSCDGYTRDSAGGAKCARSTCGHPPPKHANLSVTANAGAQPAKNPPMALPPPTVIRRSLSPGPRPPVSSDGTAPVPVPRRCRTPEPRMMGPATSQLSPGNVVTSSAPRCIFPGCTNEAFFDPNSGGGSPYCRGHMDVQYLNLTAPLSSMYVTDGNSDPAMLQSLYTTAPAKALLWQTPAAQPVASPPPLSPPTQLTPNMQLPLSPPTQQPPGKYLFKHPVSCMAVVLQCSPIHSPSSSIPS